MEVLFDDSYGNTQALEEFYKTTVGAHQPY
jgi:hypothetical protein